MGIFCDLFVLYGSLWLVLGFCEKVIKAGRVDKRVLRVSWVSFFMTQNLIFRFYVLSLRVKGWFITCFES